MPTLDPVGPQVPPARAAASACRGHAASRAGPARGLRGQARSRRWPPLFTPPRWPHFTPPLTGKTVWQVFEEERPFLMAYRGPFDGFHATEVAVSKTCLVRFDNNHYSVAARAVGRPVDVRAYADRIVIRQDGETVAEHPRSFERGEIAYDPWHYVPILTRKPGALGRIRARLTGCDVGSRFPTAIPKAGGLLDLL